MVDAYNCRKGRLFRGFVDGAEKLEPDLKGQQLLLVFKYGNL